MTFRTRYNNDNPNRDATGRTRFGNGKAGRADRDAQVVAEPAPTLTPPDDSATPTAPSRTRA
jgi:hypothetical protein